MHHHPRLRALLRLAGVAVATAALVSACGGGGGDDRPTLGSSRPTAGTTPTSLPANSSFIAQPIASSVRVHEQPDDSSPSTDYPNPYGNPYGAPSQDQPGGSPNPYGRPPTHQDPDAPTDGGDEHPPRDYPGR